MRTIRSKLTFCFGFDGHNIEEFRQQLCDFVEDALIMNPGDTLKIDLVIDEVVNSKDD